jgi:hypothetical protein
MKMSDFDKQSVNYLFITYIVTSKPKRISVAAGLVHMVKLLNGYFINILQQLLFYGVNVALSL